MYLSLTKHLRASKPFCVLRIYRVLKICRAGNASKKNTIHTDICLSPCSPPSVVLPSIQRNSYVLLIACLKWLIDIAKHDGHIRKRVARIACLALMHLALRYITEYHLFIHVPVVVYTCTIVVYPHICIYVNMPGLH